MGSPSNLCFDTRFPLHGRPRGKTFPIVPLRAFAHFSEGWRWYGGGIPSMALQVWHVCELPKRKLWRLRFFALFELCILTLYIRPPLRSSIRNFCTYLLFSPHFGSALVRVLRKNGIDNDSSLPLTLALRQRKRSSRPYRNKPKAESRKQRSLLSRSWFKGIELPGYPTNRHRREGQFFLEIGLKKPESFCLSRMYF